MRLIACNNNDGNSSCVPPQLFNETPPPVASSSSAGFPIKDVGVALHGDVDMPLTTVNGSLVDVSSGGGVRLLFRFGASDTDRASLIVL